MYVGENGGARHRALSSDEQAAAELALLDLVEADPCRTLGQFESALVDIHDIIVPTRWVRQTFARCGLRLVWRCCAACRVWRCCAAFLTAGCYWICSCTYRCTTGYHRWALSKKVNYRRAANKFKASNLARWHDFVAWVVDIPLKHLKYLDEAHCSNKG